MNKQIRKTRCSDCAFYLTYDIDAPSKKRNGVWLQPGARYCIKNRRPKQLKGNTGLRSIAEFCPIRYSIPLIRIYDFKDTWTHSTYLEMLRRGMAVYPLESDYRFQEEYESPVPIQDFQEYAQQHLDGLHTGQIVEIDDGIRSVFFFHDEKGQFCLTHLDKARFSKGEQNR